MSVYQLKHSVLSMYLGFLEQMYPLIKDGVYSIGKSGSIGKKIFINQYG